MYRLPIHHRGREQPASNAQGRASGNTELDIRRYSSNTYFSETTLYCRPGALSYIGIAKDQTLKYCAMPMHSSLKELFVAKQTATTPSIPALTSAVACRYRKIINSPTFEIQGALLFVCRTRSEDIRRGSAEEIAEVISRLARRRWRKYSGRLPKRDGNS